MKLKHTNLSTMIYCNTLHCNTDSINLVLNKLLEFVVLLLPCH